MTNKKNKKQLKDLFIEDLGRATGGKFEATTLAIGEEGPGATTEAFGEEDPYTTMAIGEEGDFPGF